MDVHKRKTLSLLSLPPELTVSLVDDPVRAHIHVVRPRAPRASCHVPPS